MLDEWAYVTGLAKRTPGRSAGTRDENNDGKSVEDFVNDANAFINGRRALGLGNQLREEHALLTEDEVIAVRLYTGPGYQCINTFLRQLATLTGEYRRELIRSPRLTLAATVAHLASAVRKLSAVATDEEATAPLYRCVRGELPKGFWTPDEQGLVCAVDMSFMSTSRARQTPVDYMGEGSNVLWALQPMRETDVGYHRGADVSMLSQFEAEKEILFPPATMLEVKKLDMLRRGGEKVQTNECGKVFMEIEVLPTFV